MKRTIRSEEILGTHGDVAAIRIMLSDMPQKQKDEALARLARQFARNLER